MLPTANLRQVYALREEIAKLTPEEQLILAEAILRGIRDSHFTDPEAYRQAVREGYEAMLAREAAQKAGSPTTSAQEGSRAAG